MYVNGMGFRGIERLTKVHHTTAIDFGEARGTQLLDAYKLELLGR